MELINHTPFPAMAYAGIDQLGQSFHIIALRQSLTFASGKLAYADVQLPLCESDLSFDLADADAGMRQESDLCSFKPRCDVVVHATAFAPGGCARSHFAANLTVTRPGIDDEAAAVPLIDKTLRISGPRMFKRAALPGRLLRQLMRVATIGLWAPTSWTLSAAQPITALRLCCSRAYGGQYRINANDAAARRVPAGRRLSVDALAGHPDANAPAAIRPILHVTCAANPAGTGLADPTYFKAAGLSRVAAPQIENPAATLSARLFCMALAGRFNNPACANPMAFEPAGLGLRSKSHPGRSRLAGTVDQAFVDGSAALPADFDFAFWNAAPPDQQTDFLTCDEVFDLTNLCAPDTSGATNDASGNTRLRLKLPGHECFVLCRQADGILYRHPMAIDTVIIEMEQATMTIVWRATLPQAPRLRVCEARMWTHEERDRAHSEAGAFSDATTGAGKSVSITAEVV